MIADETERKKIIASYNKDSETKETLAVNRVARIKDLLNVAGLTEEEQKDYNNALGYSTGGYNVIMQRDLDEVMVNSFNPEWAGTWDGNTDVHPTLDFFAVITYITEYFT